MKSDSNNRLVIISVPFYRIARVSLSELVLGRLRQVSDVIIVAPFAKEAGFQADFGGANTAFMQWELNKLNRWQRMLLAMSEIMRRNGYWRRFKKRGMSYYLKNQYRVFGNDGLDTRLSPLRCFVYWVLSMLGQSSKAWRFVNVLLAKTWCRFPGLVALSKQYEHVTLIQSANWGLQDRALATLSRLHKWRTVLLPYTSDQLDVNGYLLNRFDAVCVQGTYEFNLARDFHAVPESRIHRMGSAWFRHLETIKASSKGKCVQDESTGFILYAGVSPAYFPRISEFEAVDAIMRSIPRSKRKLKCVYRPVEPDEARRAHIRQRYEGVSNLELQWPSDAQLGLETYSAVKQENSLREYVDNLADCRLLVMSSLTSLAMDIAFLGKCGVIGNMTDAAGFLEKRHIHLANMAGYPGIRWVSSIPELLEAMENLLADPELAARESAQIIAQWDYPDVNLKNVLFQAVYGISFDGARET